MMSENPAAYVGDDVSSANGIVLMTATAITLMHDQEQLAPYIEHVMLQSTDVEPAHYGVMLTQIEMKSLFTTKAI